MAQKYNTTDDEGLQPLHPHAAIYFGVVVIVLCHLPPVFYLSCRGASRLIRRLRPASRDTTRTATEPSQSHHFSAATNASSAQLEHAEAARKRLRLRVSGSFWQLGWMLLVLGMAPLALQATFSVDTAPTIGHFVAYGSAVPWGSALIMLALRPTDAMPVRIACAFFFGACAIFAPLFAFVAANHHEYGFTPIGGVALANLCVLCILGVVILWPTLVECPCAAQFMSPRSKLLRLWLTGRLIFGLGAVSELTCELIQVLDPEFAYDEQFITPAGQSARFVLIANCLTAALICTPANRGRVVRWLSALGRGDSSVQEAAAVAALIGNLTAGNALTNALETFRALPLSMLTPEDLRPTEIRQAHSPARQRQIEEAERLSILNLHRKTVVATFGLVDAFISHSWSDECASRPWIPSPSHAMIMTYVPLTLPRCTLCSGQLKFSLLIEWAGSECETKRIWLDKV